MAAGKRKRGIMHWHRALGLTAALLVVVLSISGLALNHSDRLALNERHLAGDTVLKLYGIDPPPILFAFTAEQSWIGQIDDTLYLNEHPIASVAQPLVGAVEINSLIAIATRHAVFLTTPQGRIVDTLGTESGTPTPILALGKTQQDQLLARTASGIFQSDRNFLQWQPAPPGHSGQWSLPATPPPDLQSQWQSAQLSRAISWERLLLDLHSGRLLGAWGPYFMDAAAIALLLLAATGIWRWATTQLER